MKTRSLYILCITIVMCIAMLGGCTTIIDMATPTTPVDEKPEPSVQPGRYERVGNIIAIDDHQVDISYGAFEESFYNVQNTSDFKVGDTVGLKECDGGYEMETYKAGGSQ